MAASWLSYVNLSDHYERKARLLPALLSVIPLVPTGVMFGVPSIKLLGFLAGGIGVAAVISVGLSHLASAMGNRLQRQLWPDWPHDSPTNRRLHPAEASISSQQRKIWYNAIRRLVAIDIETAVKSGEEVKTTINDAVSSLRNMFWNFPEAKRLEIHNIDYGFARNFTGMRPIWIGFLLASAATSWGKYYQDGGFSIYWCLGLSALALFSLPFAYTFLPSYVRTRANHYADSFFGTLVAVDREFHSLNHHERDAPH